MTIQVVIPKWVNPLGREALNSFAAGLNYLALDYDIVSLEHAEASTQPMVCWGIFKTKLWKRRAIKKLQEAQKKMGGELVVIERGFVRREHHYMVGFNDINNRAKYPHDWYVSGDRWWDLQLDLKPWRTKSGGDILVIGQVPWDTACQHVNFQGWLDNTCRTLKERYEERLVFRPHPQQPAALKVPPSVDSVSKGALKDAFKKAMMVVTFCSNTGVDATIAGIPVIAMDSTSMVYEPCTNDLDHFPQPFDRRGWASWLAYCQWTLEEMERGLPWLHLHHGRAIA